MFEIVLKLFNRTFVGRQEKIEVRAFVKFT